MIKPFLKGRPILTWFILVSAHLEHAQIESFQQNNAEISNLNLCLRNICANGLKECVVKNFPLTSIGK